MRGFRRRSKSQPAHRAPGQAVVTDDGTPIARATSFSPALSLPTTRVRVTALVSTRQSSARSVSLILGFAALIPFLPAAWSFVQSGIPDVLFTGDGAALELRVLRAVRGVQLLGPYSLFGWSHPGPAYFYLALPFYELAGERGPALNLFALTVNASAAVATILAVRRLFGVVSAIAAAALVTVYVSIGAPFVVTNEWNPILPILPLALLTILAVPFARGDSTGLPALAVLASAIIQTHVGYGAPIAALAAVVLIARKRGGWTPVSRTSRLATAAVLAACWALPLYEAATARRGNIQWLIEFFAPDNLAKQTWTVAWHAVRDQSAVLPVALIRAVAPGIAPPPWLPAVFFLVQCAGLAWIIAASIRHRDRTLAALAAIPLAQWLAAMFAVRAIRQTMEFYLVAWISSIGLVASIVIAVAGARQLERLLGRKGRVVVVVTSLALVVLSFVNGPARPAVVRDRDAALERLAADVEAFVRTRQAEPPVVRIESRETWPSAVAVVLHLHKRGLSIYVDDGWLYVVGDQFAAPDARHAELRFTTAAAVAEGPPDTGLTQIAASKDLVVSFMP
jgi:hypothetical protein